MVGCVVVGCTAHLRAALAASDLVRSPLDEGVVATEEKGHRPMTEQAVEQQEPVVAAIHVWLERPDLCVSYVRLGIIVGTLRLREEAALAGARTLIGALPELDGDPELVDTVKEFLSMVTEVLAGSDGQILPLTGGGLSVLDGLFGALS